MNLDKIFGLFENNSSSKSDNDLYIDFTDNPLYWLGMWEKLVNKQSNFDRVIITLIEESKKEKKEFNLNTTEAKEAGKDLIFKMAWFYLDKIDLNNKEHCKAIKSRKNSQLKDSLNLGINHYIELEEYEKCSKIKKILEKLKES